MVIFCLQVPAVCKNARGASFIIILLKDFRRPTLVCNSHHVYHSDRGGLVDDEVFKLSLSNRTDRLSAILLLGDNFGLHKPRSDLLLLLLIEEELSKSIIAIRPKRSAFTSENLKNSTTKIISIRIVQRFSFEADSKRTDVI